MSKEKIILLIVNRLCKNMSPEENDGPDALVTREDEKPLDMDIPAIDNRLETLIKNDTVRRQHAAWRRYSIAAVFAALSVGIWLGYSRQRTAQDKNADKYLAGIIPEGEVTGTQSYLTFSNRDSVLLDTLSVGHTIQRDGCNIQKKDHNTIIYMGPPAIINNNTATGCSRHMVSVPYGHSWHIILSDGSAVYLCPGSRLIYAVNAIDKYSPRALGLQGEAFFEVKHDPYHPVAVETKKGVISVLGTRFDLRAYLREDSLRATLLNGSILLKYNGDTLKMDPGEEVYVGKKIQKGYIIDSTVSTGWRKSFFDCNNRNMLQIIREMEDWYGLRGHRFKNVDSLTPGFLGGGHIPKYSSLPPLINHMKEMAPDLSITLDGTMIVIRPNNTTT